MENFPKSNIEKITQIKMSDYESVEMTEWQSLDSQESLSDDLRSEIGKIEKGETLYDFLMNIKAKMDEVFPSSRQPAGSFVESRQTSLDECKEKGLISCGIIAKFFTTTLRLANVPVKMIHGQEKVDPSSSLQHSWLEIYNPTLDEWFRIDPGTKDFQVSDRFEQKGEFHHWSEMTPEDR